MAAAIHDERHALMEAIRLNDKDFVTSYTKAGKPLHFYTEKDYNGSDPLIISFDPRIEREFDHGIEQLGRQCVRSTRADIDRDTDTCGAWRGNQYVSKKGNAWK